MKDKIKSLLDDTAARLSVGDMDSALRLSAEALATADAVLKSSASEQGASYALSAADEDVVDLLVASDTHVRCLLMAQAPVQALSCALLSLCTVDICGIVNRDGCRDAFAALLQTTIITEMSAIDTLPLNDETHDSGTALLSLTAFLLNSYGDAADPLLAQLGQICDLTTEPIIDGISTPASDLKRILAEILGIASALGILEFE